MTGRSYGQYCGLARALELIGERWGILVVRDLLLGPKRFTDLRNDLRGIPPSLLSARLNELERAGVVRRRVLPHLEAAVVYELTEYGSDLEEILLKLALWGARSLDAPAADEVFTLDAAILSLYTTFRPDAAAGRVVGFEIVYHDLIVHALVNDGTLKVAEGAYPGADLSLRPRASIKPLLSGDLAPAEALASGLLEVDGDPALLDLFTELFRIPAAPREPECLTVR